MTLTISDTKFHRGVTKSIGRACLWTGFLVGILVQLSTLGANFVAVIMLGDNVLHASQKDVMEFSSLWSISSSLLAAAILISTRSLASFVFEHAYLLATSTTKDTITVTSQEEKAAQAALDALMDVTENRFVVGSLTGVFLAWVTTDQLMGIPMAKLQVMIILAVAWMWYRRPHLRIPPATATATATDADDESDSDSLYVTLV